MTVSYEESEDGLWIVVEALVSGENTEEIMTCPPIDGMEKRMTNILKKKGWITRSGKQIFNFKYDNDGTPLADGSVLFRYKLKPNVDSNYYH